MSKVLKRGMATLAVLIASVAFVTTALAQMPTSPWKKEPHSRKRMKNSTA